MQSNSENCSLEKDQILNKREPLEIPDIAFNVENAFYPLRVDPKDGEIKPSYQSEICTKKFIVCVKWSKRTVFFDDLSWFHANGFGLKKVNFK
jgi:hypothetical protein